MSFSPTEEQQEILSVGARGDHLIIEALAGTGKTTTLELLSHRLTGKGLYLAFNRSIAKEAEQRFAGNVICRTYHGYAFGQFGHQYSDRLEGEKNGQLSAMRIEKALSLKALGHIQPLGRATLVRDTLARFLQSADAEITPSHVPPVQLGLLFPAGTSDYRNAATEVAMDAATLWGMLWHPRSRLPIGHDCYLKAFALTQPELPFDYLTVDEGQDLNPLMIDLILQQDSQRIVVGDSHQQIYEWRGASNALNKIPNAETCYLTQSFRFGSEVAGHANVVLGTLSAHKPVRGFDTDRTNLSGPPAILLRSNMGLFGELMHRMMKRNQKCHIAGGAKDMIALLAGVADLRAGRPSPHPDLAGFTSWASFRHAAEQDGAPREMQQLVKVASSYPQKMLIQALRQGSKTKEHEADVILSTAHKSKGREFPDVFIGQDFPLPSPILNDPEEPFQPEEARLAYVALTRAQRRLRNHTDLVGAYKARLAAMISNQQKIKNQATSARTLISHLQTLPPDQKREAIKNLSSEQKTLLNAYLTNR